MELRYKQIGDYLYPELKMPEQINYEIGKYGRMRLDFIQKHRRGTYTTILTEGRLNEYLHEIDVQAAELMESAITRLADEREITEELKAMDPMRWVQEMNHAKHCAEEIVLSEVIYN